MTVWAFVSDIHGNYGALQHAASWCAQNGVDRYVCLGDVIGRGKPDACVAWVRDHADLAIVGNRDLDYLDRVTPELREVVLGWTNEAQRSDFVVSHGDPKLHRRLSSAAVRDEFQGAGAFMEQANVTLWFFGHTHRARIWKLPCRDSESARVERSEPELLEELRIELDPRARYVVNVGTTGMPLPGRGAAAFALYDDVARELRVIPLPSCADRGR